MLAKKQQSAGNQHKALPQQPQKKSTLPLSTSTSTSTPPIITTTAVTESKPMLRSTVPVPTIAPRPRTSDSVLGENEPENEAWETVKSKKAKPSPLQKQGSTGRNQPSSSAMQRTSNKTATPAKKQDESKNQITPPTQPQKSSHTEHHKQRETDIAPLSNDEKDRVDDKAVKIVLPMSHNRTWSDLLMSNNNTNNNNTNIGRNVAPQKASAITTPVGKKTASAIAAAPATAKTVTKTTTGVTAAVSVSATAPSTAATTTETAMTNQSPVVHTEQKNESSDAVEAPEGDEWTSDPTSKKKKKTQERKQRQAERVPTLEELTMKGEYVIRGVVRPMVDPRPEPLGYTALHEAVLKRDVTKVSELLRISPGLVNTRSKYSDTPLDLCGEINTRLLTGPFGYNAEVKVAASPEIEKLLTDAGGIRNVRLDISEHLPDLLSPFFPEVVAQIIVMYSQRIDHPLFSKAFAFWTVFDAPDPRRPLQPIPNNRRRWRTPTWTSRIHFMTPNSVLQQISMQYTIYSDLCLYRRGTYCYEEAVMPNFDVHSSLKKAHAKDALAFEVKINWLMEWWKGISKPEGQDDPELSTPGKYENIDDIVPIDRVQKISLICEPRSIELDSTLLERIDNGRGHVMPNPNYLVTGYTEEPVHAWAQLPPSIDLPPVPCVYGDIQDSNQDPEPAWCLAPWTLVIMWDGFLRRADELQPGDRVASENGHCTTIECVVVMSGSGDCPKSLVNLGDGLVVTQGHPIKPPRSRCESQKLIEGVWCRPHEVAPKIKCRLSRLFNFVTSQRDSILLSKSEDSEYWTASTLGQFCHGIDDPTSFFGTERVVESLRANKAWPYIEFLNQW